MKVKGLIISITAGTALIVGTAYGIGMGMKKKAQPGKAGGQGQKGRQADDL